MAIPIESACWRALACSEAPASCHASAASYSYPEDVLSLAIVKPKLKFIQVERQIFGADVVVRSDDSALEQSPKRLNRIGVNLAANVLAARVRDRFVADAPTDVVVILIVVSRDQFNMIADDFADESGQRDRLGVSDESANHVALALNRPDDTDLEVALAGARQALLTAFFIKVPVAILAADVGLVNFNDSHQFAEIGVGHASPQPMAHIEGRPVGASTEHPVNLQGTDTFFGREHQVENLEPHQERFLGFLENGSGCEGEAVGRAIGFTALFTLPVPETRSLARIDVIIAAANALDDAFGPAPIEQIRAAGILIREQLLELTDGHLADDLRFGVAVMLLCHDPNVAHIHVVVKCRILPS
jgi:hypothetical protein